MILCRYASRRAQTVGFVVRFALASSPSDLRNACTRSFDCLSSSGVAPASGDDLQFVTNPQLFTAAFADVRSFGADICNVGGDVASSVRGRNQPAPSGPADAAL